MVDITGHVAFGLAFAAVAWFVWDDRVAVAFVALAALAALLPDVDIWLSAAFPAEVHHHGVTHTVLFATVASVVGGALVAGLFTGRFDDWAGTERFGRGRLFGFATGALFAGSVSHVVADMLSAPDVSTPIEPFWPFFEKPWSVDVLHYDAAWVNFGFLTVVILVHVALAYVTTPADRRHRLLPS